jgi:hypothetical protein
MALLDALQALVAQALTAHVDDNQRAGLATETLGHARDRGSADETLFVRQLSVNP